MFEIDRAALGDQLASAHSRSRPELDHPVGVPDELPFVLDDHDRVSVADQRLDRTSEPRDVARVQADGWLVEDVEHARGIRPDRRRELDPLALPRGERRPRSVEREIAEADVEQRTDPAFELGEQSLGHSSYRRGKATGQRRCELTESGEIERAHLGQVSPAQTGGERLGPQPRAATHRADARVRKTPRELPSALVVTAKRALHGGDRIVVVDGQLDGAAGPPGGEGDLALDRRSVQHDLALALGERPVRDVEPHALLSRGVHREAASPTVPRQDRTFFDCLVLVGDQGFRVHLRADTEAMTRRARAVGVEGERLRAGMGEVHATRRADDFHADRCDGGLDDMTVGADMRTEARHH